MLIENAVQGSAIQPAEPARAGWLDIHDPVLFEEASKPWEIRVTPLEAGPFRNRKQYLITPAFVLYRDSFAGAVRLSGLTPPGVFGLAIPVQLGRRTCFWRAPLHDAGLPASFPGALEAVIDAAQSHVILLIELGFLFSALPAETFAALKQAAADRLLRASQDKIARLARWLLQCLDRAHREPALLEHPVALATLSRDVLARLLNTVELPVARDCRRQASPLRRYALDRALAFLREADLSALSVPQLCLEAGVSERTLQYAFLETFDMSPLAFLRQGRFHAVRRKLLLAAPGELSITEAAYSAGFYQVGRFAVEYRQLFGERPMDTLRRSAPA